MKRTLGAIVTVLVKESLDNLRDRRTLLASLVMGPLLGPLLIVWMMNTVVSRTSSDLEKPLELPVIGAEQAPNLVAFLAEHNAHVVTGPTKPRDAVRSRDVKLVLEIPPGFGEAFRKGEPAAVRV
ncbi:MAG: ABC transporter permease, partial [Gammaproteobacteria bacterium]